MGVKRISVGGIQAPEFFKSRDWHIPFLGLFSLEPTVTTRGRRSATCTGQTQYRAWGRALYLSTGNTGANQVFELAEASLINTPGTIWDYPFYFAMTLNQTSGSISNAAGECCQGFGIGNMNRDTPWIGQSAQIGSGGTCCHVRWNLARQKFELFAANEAGDLGTTVDLQTQPNFTIDQRVPEIAMEWIPPNIINIYCNGQLIHTQNMDKMLPNVGVFGNSSQNETCMFLTNGSNAAFGHSEAGFYFPRFYQSFPYQPVF